jgi:hypothetical protein
MHGRKQALGASWYCLEFSVALRISFQLLPQCRFLRREIFRFGTVQIDLPLRLHAELLGLQNSILSHPPIRSKHNLVKSFAITF